MILNVVLFGICSSAVWAGVYQCVDEKGIIEFRDRPCQSSQEKETFLPIGFSKTDPKEQKKEEKKLKLTGKKLEADKQREVRIHERAEKKRLIEAQKMQRRKLRCQRLDEKLYEIDNQLRAGSKAKRLQRLKEQKEHCEKMKHRYCSALM